MLDRDLYSQILGVRAPWSVTDVKLDMKGQKVEVIVSLDPAHETTCPTCGKPAMRYDARRRRWRHLDTCQLKTILAADVPRLECPVHKVVQMRVPWAEENSRFTALFECLVIDWLLGTGGAIAPIAQQMRLSWEEVDGIKSRAVERGLARRKPEETDQLCVDETSFRRRHDYVTVVSSSIESRVLYVGDDRTQESLDAYFKKLTPEQLAAVVSVSMDMSAAYVASTRAYIPDADDKIAFDKFHVAKILGDAVDKVRRGENAELMAAGDKSLVHSKHLWLENPDNMSAERWSGRFAALRESCLRTARAWGMKETAMALWHYVSKTWAEKGWRRWISWATRSRLDPMKKAARTVKNHLWGILNAVVNKVTNATAESLNSKIQRIKRAACGFRNKDRFKNAIYFHLGGLDLYPGTALATHTNY
jgi:transposase